MTETELEPDKSFEEVIEKLQKRKNDRKEPSLKNTERALNQFGRPDEDYEVILVGGTNGKGSTVEMISELLQSQAFDVGTYKSPHLVTARERVRVNVEKISEGEFLELYGRIASLDLQLTFFEFMTVLAYVYFSDEDVDYAIMEVGMGGRLDATNAADNDTAVITNIGKDHMKYLGDTKAQIAQEKAGIIPEDGTLITSSDSQTLENVADRRNAEILEPEEIEARENSYIFRDQEFRIPLEGSFQKYNLENALKTVAHLEDIPEDLESALSDLKCSGRMEIISEDPEIILDGAHNASALEETIDDYPEDFICVFGAVKSKEIDEMISILEQKASEFYVTKTGVDWSEQPEKIAGHISKDYEIIEDPSKALKAAKSEINDQKSIVVTGSLYMIGDLKDSMGEESRKQ